MTDLLTGAPPGPLIYLSTKGSIYMSTFPPHKLTLQNSTGKAIASQAIAERKVKHSNRQQRFLKGPVPLPWIIAASQLPGKALVVGIAIWFRAGLTGSSSITLSSSHLTLWGIDRHSKRRALDVLEKASLITVDRCNGKNPIITIIKEVEEL